MSDVNGIAEITERVSKDLEQPLYISAMFVRSTIVALGNIIAETQDPKTIIKLRNFGFFDIRTHYQGKWFNVWTQEIQEKKPYLFIRFRSAKKLRDRLNKRNKKDAV